MSPNFPSITLPKLATANGALPFDQECVVFRFRHSFNQEIQGTDGLKLSLMIKVTSWAPIAKN